MVKILLGILLIVGVNPSFGQKKQKITVQALSDVRVDADLKEWDALNEVAEEGLWFYQLAQDASNLYVAVRVEDAFLQNLATRNGILFSVLADKKKKDDIQFLFPYPDSEVKRAMITEDHDSDEDYKTTLIARSRGYFVSGFPQVPNGLLSLDNNYGLHAAARMDDGILYYEAVVPKSVLDYTTPVARVKLAINDGVTTLASSNQKNTVRSGGMYGSYRGRPAPRTKNKLTMVVLLETKID